MGFTAKLDYLLRRAYTDTLHPEKSAKGNPQPLISEYVQYKLVHFICRFCVE